MKTLHQRIKEAVEEYHNESLECAYDPEVLVHSICYEVQEFIKDNTK